MYPFPWVCIKDIHLVFIMNHLQVHYFSILSRGKVEVKALARAR